MTTYATEQANTLIETGKCHFAIDWHDVIRAAMRHERFEAAVNRAYIGNPVALRILVNATAHKLCRDFDHAS